MIVEDVLSASSRLPGGSARPLQAAAAAAAAAAACLCHRFPAVPCPSPTPQTGQVVAIKKIQVGEKGEVRLIAPAHPYARPASCPRAIPCSVLPCRA